MNELFDLTTQAGFQAVTGMAGFAGKAASKIELDAKTLAIGAGIVGVVAAGLYIASKFSDTPSPEEQCKAASDLVEKMRAQGAKSVKVRVSQEAYAEMKSKIPGKFNVKGSGNGYVELEVTFD